MSRSMIVRRILIGSASAALVAGAGMATISPASAHGLPRPVAQTPSWDPFDELCAEPEWASGWGSGWQGSWQDDDWQIDWSADVCADPAGTAQADLEAALAVAQSTFDDAAAAAKSAFNTGVADELAAYREDRASTRSQIARLLIWRGFLAATRDEQRILNRATDAATRNLALDQDAAYEIFDLETTDETVAAGRTDFRVARATADRVRTLALRAIGVSYEEAVDITVQRLAASQEETGSTAGRARAWKAYRTSLAAARAGRASAAQEIQAQYDSAIDEAAALLAPGDESYRFDDGIRPVAMPMPHHQGHGNGHGHGHGHGHDLDD